MKKPNLTEGEWKVKRYSNSQPYIGVDRANGGAVCDIIQYRTESNANAKAIVTAVNNTYHKGIDPEGVPDMKEALIKARDVLTYLGGFEDTSTVKHVNMIDRALEKAGVTINEKAE